MTIFVWDNKACRYVTATDEYLDAFIEIMAANLAWTERNEY